MKLNSIHQLILIILIIGKSIVVVADPIVLSRLYYEVLVYPREFPKTSYIKKRLNIINSAKLNEDGLSSYYDIPEHKAHRNGIESIFYADTEIELFDHITYMGGLSKYNTNKNERDFFVHYFAVIKPPDSKGHSSIDFIARVPKAYPDSSEVPIDAWINMNADISTYYDKVTDDFLLATQGIDQGVFTDVLKDDELFLFRRITLEYSSDDQLHALLRSGARQLNILMYR